MPNSKGYKITAARRALALAMLIESQPYERITEATRIPQKGLERLFTKHSDYIHAQRQALAEGIIKDELTKYKEIVRDALNIARRAAANITDDKLLKSSAAQLTSILGICIDKYNLSVGNATEIIKVQSREEMVDEILKPKNVEQSPIIEIPTPQKVDVLPRKELVN